MEHRYGIRQPLGIEALVQSPSLGKRRVRIRDISIGGLFVEMPTAGLAPNMVLRLVFVATRNHRRRLHRIQGVVTRVTETGAALSFDFLPVSAQISLLTLLKTT